MTNSIHADRNRDSAAVAVPLTSASTTGPTVAVLAPQWETSSEAGWITRQVAGALACLGTVHVLIPGNGAASVRTDGVFTVHRLAGLLRPQALAERNLVADALAAGDRAREEQDAHGRPVQPETTLLDRGITEAWRPASGVLKDLTPDLIVLVDHRNLGALAAVQHHSATVPVALLALDDGRGHLDLTEFAPVLDRADAVLAITEAERLRLEAALAARGMSIPVNRIGAPMVANSSARSEPNTWVGDSDYLFVLTDTSSEDTSMQTELARLLTLRFCDRPVGIAHTDGFFAWHEGRVNDGWAIERSSDRARLMAWARVTIDLRHASLFGRDVIESLLFGTPVVVPCDSQARQHAHLGGGGLWFEGPADLTWAAEALLDPALSEQLSRQGKAYAEEQFGSTDRFIDRVISACQLDVSDLPEVVRSPAAAQA